MAAPALSSNDEPARWGYIAAVIASAIAHAAVAAVLLLILPWLFNAKKLPPIAYTVKVVDSIPAGDLGTRLPRINAESAREHPKPQAHQDRTPQPSAQPTPPPDNDRNAIALNTKSKPTPTPTPKETAAPIGTPTPRPRHTPRPTPKPTPKAARAPRSKITPKPKTTPAPIVMAKEEPSPSVQEQLKKLREQLLAEHLKEIKEKAAADAAKHAKPVGNPGSGPVVADRESAGRGMGVGPGSGSAGIQQDPDFLLYYHDVQERIKKAWSFSGNNPDLTATVTFGINPDGSLNSVKVTDTSRDPAFDDSVVRAIRRAAPFTPPPGKYRAQFAEGVEAVFKLGELNS